MKGKIAEAFLSAAITFAMAEVVKLAGRKSDAKFIKLAGYSTTAILGLQAVFGVVDGASATWFGKLIRKITTAK